jgi:peroxiredoxin
MFLAACGKGDKSASGKKVTGNTKIIGVFENGKGKILVAGRAVNRQFKELARDSVSDKDFALGFDLKNPEVIYLQVENGRSSLPVLVKPGSTVKLEIKDNLDRVDITEGPVMTKAFHKFINLLDSYREQSKKIEAEYQQALASGDKAKMESLKEKFQRLDNEKTEKLIQMAAEEKDNLTGAIILETLTYKSDVDFEKLKEIYQSMPDEIKQSTYGANAWRQIQTNLITAIGRKAPDFEAPTPDGKTLKMSDVLKKSKVLVIDFWASWCRPCRAENPYVVEIYKKYHGKGLNILGVSLDKPGAKDKWLKAIKDDHLDWYHVSNLQFWNDPVAKKYGIMSIPATLILDKNGVIRAKNLRREKLEAKIKELLNE